MSIFKFKKTPPSDNDFPVRNKEELAPLKDPFIMPKNTEDLKPWHYKALRKLNKCPVNNTPLTGIITREVNIPEFITAAEQMRLIFVVSGNDVLKYLKNDALKQILKHYGLAISGNKDKLVERIMNNVSESDLRNWDEYSEIYILTNTGQNLINESYKKIREEENKFFKQVIDLIMGKEFDTAYRLACKKNAEKPVPPGINCDWKGWYERGITNRMLQESVLLMKESDTPLISAAALYSLYSGDSNRDVAHIM